MRLAPLALSLSLCLPLVSTALPAADETVTTDTKVTIGLDGWRGEQEQYSNPVDLKVGEDGGQKNLSIAVKGGEKDKAAVCKAMTGIRLPAAAILKLRVANTGQVAVPMTIALKTGNGWTFHESERVSVKPGTQDIAFDLSASTFKSEATGWKNTGAIADLGHPRELQLGIYNGKAEVTLVVSGLVAEAKP